MNTHAEKPSVDPQPGLITSISVLMRYAIISCSARLTLTHAGLAIVGKLITVFTFTAEGPGLVVADGAGATDLRILSALVIV